MGFILAWHFCQQHLLDIFIFPGNTGRGPSLPDSFFEIGKPIIVLKNGIIASVQHILCTHVSHCWQPKTQRDQCRAGTAPWLGRGAALKGDPRAWQQTVLLICDSTAPNGDLSFTWLILG